MKIQENFIVICPTWGEDCVYSIYYDRYGIITYHDSAMVLCHKLGINYDTFGNDMAVNNYLDSYCNSNDRRFVFVGNYTPPETEVPSNIVIEATEKDMDYDYDKFYNNAVDYALGTIAMREDLTVSESMHDFCLALEDKGFRELIKQKLKISNINKEVVTNYCCGGYRD